MFRCARTAITLLTFLAPFELAYASGNPLTETPLYPLVDNWIETTDPFNGEKRLVGHVDESDGLKISLQWYCPRTDTRFHLGIDVEGHKLDAIDIKSKHVIWLRQKLDNDEAKSLYTEIEDDYRFTIPDIFNSEKDRMLMVGFSVSGRERIFLIGLSGTVKQIANSTCPQTNEYDPYVDVLPSPSEGLRPPPQMR